MASTYQTLGNVYTIVRSLANKDSNTLTDATLLAFANKYYYLLVRELVGLGEELYAEIASTALVADQREYSLPTDDTSSTFGGGAIKIQRVEVAYDGSNWHVATHIPFTEIRTPTILDADIDSEYSKDFPKYYVKDRSLFLVPTPDSDDSVAGGNTNLRIFWIKRPNELTSSSSIPDLPKDWLAVLQEGMLYDVFRKFGRTADARDALTNWNLGVARMRELEQGIDEEEKYNLRAYPKNYR